MSRQYQHWVILLALILLGFALRLFHLNQASLRGDEAFTVIHWMREPLQQTLTSILTIDPQPPLAYALYYFFGQIAGTQAYIVRFLPAFLNLLGIPALYAIGNRLGNRSIGYIAAALFAISPAILWHAQDARNYPIWAAFAAVSLWLGLAALERRRRIDWALFIAATAIACYLYYLQLFFVAVLNVYVFIVFWRSKKLLLHWVVSQIILGLILAPWFLNPELLSGGGYAGTAGRSDISEYITAFIPTLTYGSAINPELLWLAIGVVLALMGIGLYTLFRLNRKAALLCLLWGIIPLILIGIVSTRLNVFVPRYVLASSTAYFILISGGIYTIWHSKHKILQVATAGLSFLFVSLLCVSLFNYYFNDTYAKSPHWRELAAFLSLRVQPEDSIVNTSADPALTFYLRELGISAEELYLPANPNQSRLEIEEILQERLNSGANIWLVANPQGGWANANVPQEYLQAHAQSLRQTNIEGIPVNQFHAWETDAFSSSSIAQFGDIAALAGSQIDAPPYPDNQLTLQLVWRAVGRSSTPLKVFLHLRQDASSVPIAQDDQFMQSGSADTSTWVLGQLYRDAYSLPLEAVPPGEYALYVGFYDPETGDRLTIDGSSDDEWLIGAVTIP